MLPSTPPRCAGERERRVSTDAAVRDRTVITWLTAAEAAVSERADYLTQLDAAIGDGDHGINMTRGFAAVGKALAGQGDALPPGRALVLAGKTLVSTVGGASGPLWGSALRAAGRALGDAERLDGPALADALDAALAAVVDLGAAAPGDKTMVDALGPATAALREQLDAGASLADATASAAAAAEEGAQSTVPMQARKGRASYLGERSIGHQDPGATSAALIVRALHEAVAREA
jgi:phosphoenolpyruvate---glycerone phosphotransferase subunit DhaL